MNNYDRMLTMYMKPTCPWCRRVMPVIDRLELDVEMKDISTDESLIEELIAAGGKRQVPYLIDTDHDVAMYESDDIIKYLQETYGAAVSEGKPRVHVGGSTCVSCEG